MPELLSKPRGTLDVLPGESWKYQYIEKTMRDVLHRFGFSEIRTPVFEATELFNRGVGDTTDIVAKEMYTFEDKGGRSMTLRPEGTAGAVRAVLENGLLASAPLPLKLYYIDDCYRYEKVQKGRYRAFHQMGIECYGTREPAADAEVIETAAGVLGALHILDDTKLEINSIGCPECRPHYYAALREYYRQYEAELCPLCQARLSRNPMRLLDCKEDNCREIAKNAPVVLDYLCEDCETHFTAVKFLLSDSGLAFTVNPRIVRGLDYYTNTVFEFIASGVGTQGTVCGGGRYDGLVSGLGGQPTPGVGFGMGVERTLLALEEAGALPKPPGGPALYAVGIGDAGKKAARRAVRRLRGANFAAECDLSGRSLKAQMKAANRLGAVFTAVFGDDEAANGTAKLKDMETGSETPFALDEIGTALGEAMFARTAAAFDRYFDADGQ